MILIRLVVGGVFLSEGIQKFLFPNELGAGRFHKIGIPAPDTMGPFVGLVTITCGSLMVVGLLTRLVAIPLIIDMCVALISTKLQSFWTMGSGSSVLANWHPKGFWSFAHEARTDFSMLLCSIFLLIVGAGAWSLDVQLGSKRLPPRHELSVRLQSCERNPAV